jgi:glycosyltransferase involved in cell wall biosynthesis
MLISSYYRVGGGGSGVIVHHLARGLSAAGHAVSVVTLGKTRYFSMEQEQDIKVYRFRPLNLYPLEEKDLHPLWQKLIWQLIDIYNIQSAGVLRKVLVKESPDIVHINKMRGFSGAVWSISTRLFPGRVIQTCHDYESMSPDGLMRGITGQMALQKQWPIRGYQLIRKCLSRQVSTLTAPSEFTLKRIVNSGLFASAQTRVIPNTHGWKNNELKSIHDKVYPPPNDRQIKFLFIGRLEAEKGIKVLCEAFSQLHKSYPYVKLDVAGWGTLEMDLHNKFGLHPGIKFLGIIDGKPKEDVLYSATAVIVPSLVEEVFGLTVVEAFAFGKPVIGCRLGGLPELIRHGETGWLVEAGNIQALTNSMENVIKTDPLSLANMTKNCMKYSYNFSLEKIIQEYEDIYRQLAHE